MKYLLELTKVLFVLNATNNIQILFWYHQIFLLVLWLFIISWTTTEQAYLFKIIVLLNKHYLDFWYKNCYFHLLLHFFSEIFFNCRFNEFFLSNFIILILFSKALCFPINGIIKEIITFSLFLNARTTPSSNNSDGFFYNFYKHFFSFLSALLLFLQKKSSMIDIVFRVLER